MSYEVSQALVASLRHLEVTELDQWGFFSRLYDANKSNHRQKGNSFVEPCTYTTLSYNLSEQPQEVSLESLLEGDPLDFLVLEGHEQTDNAVGVSSSQFAWNDDIV